MEQVLEQGPWLIRNIPLILTKWTPNLTLSKDKEVPREKAYGTTKNNKGFKVNNSKQQVRYQIMWNNNKKHADKETQTGDSGGVEVKNIFKKLYDLTVLVDLNEPETQHNIGDPSTIMTEEAEKVQTDESDSEVDEDIIVETKKTKLRGQALPLHKFSMFSIASWNIRGLNRTLKKSEVRYLVNENQLSVCAILEPHVEISRLSHVCSKVFKGWDWTSNASYYSKGCRIILGWNTDIYSAMNDFKECVNKIEILDIKSSGLHFTWNKKPKNRSGLLKNLDRIMCNLDFVDHFQGAYGMFQPYRLSDHSSAVIKIPTLMSGSSLTILLISLRSSVMTFRPLLRSLMEELLLSREPMEEAISGIRGTVTWGVGRDVWKGSGEVRVYKKAVWGRKGNSDFGQEILVGVS
nr:RNA-directed DNA polymerase, eukaryota, reverse transcriptase zinc-binding domain protein [Tanacetum cinerariifolium]